ncbi:MAG: hypothetical protein JST93_00850 [Acidobacteria bacterium]|nr:hypothetical protein [Acidobacteriota bacterium]
MQSDAELVIGAAYAAIGPGDLPETFIPLQFTRESTSDYRLRIPAISRNARILIVAQLRGGDQLEAYLKGALTATPALPRNSPRLHAGRRLHHRTISIPRPGAR